MNKAIQYKTWFERLFKIDSCEKCGSWSIKKGYYSSGWNNWCQQASGDRGVICCDCLHIKFDELIEIRRAKAPKWITVNI